MESAPARVAQPPGFAGVRILGTLRAERTLPAATSTTRCCTGSSLGRRWRGFGHRPGRGACRADLLLVLPVSIAWPVDDDDVAVVEQPVDEGGRAEVIAEVVAPAFPGDVAG